MNDHLERLLLYFSGREKGSCLARFRALRESFDASSEPDSMHRERQREES